MIASPLISVVVPAYNSSRFLGETLESLAAQSVERWECIVVDDGSTDDSFAIASGFAARDSRFQVRQTAHGGSSHARNEGSRATDTGSRYVTFMDSDDVWLPHAFATLLEHLEGQERLVGCHGLADLIDANGVRYAPGEYADAGRNRLGLEGRRLVHWPLDRPTTFDVLVNGNVLFPPGLLLARRSAYESAGPFDETLAGPEDWDMLIRLSRFGDLAFANDVILLYRRHDANQGARPTTPEQAWRVRCIAFHSPENSPDQRRRARRGWRAYQMMMMRLRLSEAVTALRERRLRDAFDRGARLVAHVGRYVRGYPLPRVARERLVW